ncbi:hypothetical protein COOONC_15097, partial [Cooperia oncophora]
AQAASAGHHSHPNQNFIPAVPGIQRSDSLETSSEDSALAMSTASAPSESNHSKFSYSITLPGSVTSLDEAEGSGENSQQRGDVPSLVLSKSETDRAHGGKASDEVNLSELVHSILTSSSRSDRSAVRDQLNQLIRRHMKDEADRQSLDLTPSARQDAAALRISGVLFRSISKLLNRKGSIQHTHIYSLG